MKPIFLSYSSKHRDLTQELARGIEGQYGAGSVWWDHALESWGDYEIQIRNAINEARVVVVIWTKAAADSDWVKSEAGRANRDRKLVNVRHADTPWCDVPSPYDQHHVNSLDDVQGIMRSIEAVWGGRPVRTALPLHEIYYRQQGHRLIDPKQHKLARHPHEVSPTDLLQAKYGVVDYIDVTGTRAALIDWCTTGSRPTAGRLVHGPGGLGKTRLMISVAARLREQGWTAGFLDRPHEQVDTTLKQRWQALDQLIAHGEDKGLLIIMDYTEGRSEEVKKIAERLSGRPESDTRSIRLVLLARVAGEWWDKLHDETSELQHVFCGTSSAPEVIALPTISTGRHRLDLFGGSLRAFGPLLAAQGYVLPKDEPSQERLRRIEVGAGYTRPLAVEMEALLWLASAGPEADDTAVDALLRCFLGMERNHWKKIRGALEEEHIRDIARGVAQVTVVQGVPTLAETERLLMADGFYQGHRTARVAVDPVVRDLSHLYGIPDGGIGQLEPDLIGEHHVATVGDIELIDGCLRWVESEPPDRRGRRHRDLVTVLQRATQPEHGAKANDLAVAMLDHLVSKHGPTLAGEMVAVMVDTPGALADRLDRQLDTLDDESLGAVDTALPLQSLALMDLSLHVAKRRLDLAREYLVAVEAVGDGASPDRRETTLEHLGARLGTLDIRLSNLGRREEALAASQEAVEIYRGLAQTRPDAFLPDLASSLNNLGRNLSNLGRREEALAASQEAVEIYRGLAQTRPDAFLPELASSLNNLGRILSNLGRREEALAASQEAVEIRRRLAQTRPDAFLPVLASSLNNLGRNLSNLGRREEALAASQEASEIRRHLAQTRPDAFLPDLAMSLNSLGVDLSNLGRREEALAASQEAVEIRRHLAQTRPDAFLPDLASSLNNTGAMLSNLGRREEALAASQEAVEIRRRLAQTRPDAFLAALAGSLNNLGNRLSNLGRREEALAASQEAVEIRKHLAQTQPDAFLPDFASSLNNLGADLSNLGRREEALAASQEAVEIHRGLAQTRPDASLPDLAMSLNSLGVDLSNLGRREEALAASQEAVEIYRGLAQIRPDVFLPDLAMSISIMSQVLAALDRKAIAAQTAHEALEILTPLVERYPETYRDLARAITADVLSYSEAAGETPNRALLRRVAQTFDSRRSGEAMP